MDPCITSHLTKKKKEKEEKNNKLIKQKVKEETGSGEEQSRATQPPQSSIIASMINSAQRAAFQLIHNKIANADFENSQLPPSLPPTLNGKGFKTGGKDYMVRKQVL